MTLSGGSTKPEVKPMECTALRRLNCSHSNGLGKLFGMWLNCISLMFARKDRSRGSRRNGASGKVRCFVLGISRIPLLILSALSAIAALISGAFLPHYTLIQGMAGGHLKYRHLGRKSSHRQALLRNLVTSLFEHESISTTWPKAKEAQRLAEKLITLGKRNTQAAKNRAQGIFYV